MRSGMRGEGFPMSRGQAAGTAHAAAELKEVPGFADTFLIDGKPPAAARKFKQAALAATLDQLAHAGLDDFYRGDIGREIAADLDRVGSPVTRADLERCRATRRRAAVACALAVGTAYNTPLPTPGIASLIILALFERLGVTEAEGFDHVHGLVEATKRALAVRDRYVTDPARQPRAGRSLSQRRVPRRAGGRDRSPQGDAPRRCRRARATPSGWAPPMRPASSSPTSSRSTGSYGSGVVLPKTGVLMQNRGISFSLDREPQRARARPAAAAYAQPGARRAARRAA